MLTDLRCKSAKPSDKPYKLADDRGLFLFVTKTGFKSWRWKYRFAGQEKQLVLGPYPLYSLAHARTWRDEASRTLRDGLDPGQLRKQRIAAIAADTVNSFEAIARRWHEKREATWSTKHAAAVLASLTDNVFPRLGKLPITKIDVPLVLAVVQAIEDRGAVETAHRVRGRMSDVFGFAIGAGLATNDPAAIVQKAMRPISKGRRPALRTIEDARALLRAAESIPAHPATKLASRLLAITAVRPGVLRTAPPTEFEALDGPAPIWRVPAARMKLSLERKADASFEFIVPLPPQAVEIVRLALRLSDGSPFLFPSTHHYHRPMSENTIGFLYNRLPAFVGRHVPHGWRATFSTIMNELADRLNRPGDRAIIDLMLAHTPPGVEGLYNRAAYMPRRREIVDEWATLLLKGLPPAEQLLHGPRK